MSTNKFEKYKVSPYTDPTLTRRERSQRYTGYALHLLGHILQGWTTSALLTPYVIDFFRYPGHKQLFELFLSEVPGAKKAANTAFSMAINTHSTMVISTQPTGPGVLAYLYMYLAIDVTPKNSELRDMLVGVIRENAAHWNSSESQ